MGIELQSAPQGHHKITGSHGQSSKSAETDPPEGAFGFAALMSLMSGQDREGSNLDDGSGSILLSTGIDSTLVTPLANLGGNAARVGDQPIDSAVVALPSTSQKFNAHVAQISDLGWNPVGQGVGAVDLLGRKVQSQPAMVCAGRQGIDPAKSAGSQGVSVVVDPSSLVVNQLGSSDITAAPVAFQTSLNDGATETLPIKMPAGTQLLARSTDPVSIATAGLSAVKEPIQATGNLKITSDHIGLPASTLSTLPTVSLDAKLPSTVPVQPELVPANVPSQVVDLSKVVAKPVLVGQELSNPANDSADVKTQVPTIVESFEDVPAQKSSGGWTSQQPTFAGMGRQELKEMASGFAAVSMHSSVAVSNSQEAGVRVSERPVKLVPSRFNSGSEGVYGQPLAPATAADAQFQESSTIAAASTTLADTVSQWASQGVQSASLQLDGLGDQPVEVRISVNGEMAQVDFKTNQPEIRQVIEGAASQLKELLSSQGLQLAGMSIGTSARGGEQFKEKDTKPATDARKVTQVKSDIVETGRVRMANPSVGQSLDLFV